MSSDAENLAAKQVVESIRRAFPKEAAQVDAIVQRDGFENAHCIWVEHFSQLTTNAIRARDYEKSKARLILLSGVLSRGDSATKRCIDVAYVESLMWDIKDDKVKREGWKLIPENLRLLYVGMWGQRPFMKGSK
jgi:hypothetical protein